MNQRLTFLAFIHLFFISHSFGLDLSPDLNEDHCNSFSGEWVKGKCIDRLEFQQKMISGRENIIQWCHARGGNYSKSRRGSKCLNEKSTQGLRKYPVRISAKYQVYRDVMKSCLFLQDMPHQKCEVLKANENSSNYDYTNNPSVFGSTVVALVSSVIQSANEIRSTTVGKKERDYLMSSLKDWVYKYKFNSCQKACLVKCASSKVLEYSTEDETKVLSINDIYNKRRGECTEFMRVAIDIGDVLGVPIKIAVGAGHAFNSFKIDGQWYYGEPQDHKCEFYHSLITQSKYEDVMGDSEKKYDGERTEIKYIRDDKKEMRLPHKYKRRALSE